MPECTPQLISIDEARKRLGGIGRTKFYTTTLPKLERVAKDIGGFATIRLGRRRMVCQTVVNTFIMRGGDAGLPD